MSININTIIIRRESFLESFLSDTYSLVILGFLFWFNYRFIGGSYFVNFLILVLILVFLFSKILSTTKVTSYKKVSDEDIDKINIELSKKYKKEQSPST